MQPERKKILLRRVALFAVALIALVLIWHALDIKAAKWALTQAPQGQAEGPATAQITIVEFMDYRCHPCRALAPVLQQVLAQHPEVRVVYRHLPVYGAPSVNEARLALAAGLQGKFAAMHALLLAHDAPVEQNELPALAKQAGVDLTQLQRDTINPAITATLLQTARAATLLHVRADPSFLIGGTLYDTAHGMPTVATFNNLIAAAKR